MDRLVEQFLYARSLDPVFGTVADATLSAAGPEHGAPIIRDANGNLRLGQLSASRTDYTTVSIEFPRLAAGEQYVGVIHSHPGNLRGLSLGHSADLDVPGMSRLPQRLGVRSFRSYVVAAGKGPHFGVHTFEPLPRPGALIPLTP
jgi:hypothetical protein